MKKIFFIFLILSLSLNLFSVDLTTGEKKGKVTIGFEKLYRIDFSLKGMVSEKRGFIMLNQSVIAKLKKDEYVEFELNPGTYYVHFSGYGDEVHDAEYFDVFKFVIKENSELFFILGGNSMDMNTVTEVESKEAFSNFTQIDEVEWVSFDE